MTQKKKLTFKEKWKIGRKGYYENGDTRAIAAFWIFSPPILMMGIGITIPILRYKTPDNVLANILGATFLITITFITLLAIFFLYLLAYHPAVTDGNLE